MSINMCRRIFRCVSLWLCACMSLVVRMRESGSALVGVSASMSIVTRYTQVLPELVFLQPAVRPERHDGNIYGASFHEVTTR